MMALISPVNLADSSASDLTSSATTAKPLPISPALAASIAALRERRLVWSEIDCIISLAFAIVSVALLVSTITPSTFSDISLFSLVILTSSSMIRLLSFFRPSMLSIDFESSPTSVIMPFNTLPDSSTDIAALWVSLAWLVAPSAMLLTACETSPEDSAADCEVAVSSSAIAAVFCACADISPTMPTRFLTIVSIERTRLPTSSLLFLYFSTFAASSLTSRL